MTPKTKIETIIVNGVASRCMREGKPSIPIWKRILDISIIVLTLPLWFPVGLLVALLIKIFSPGPVFYFQKRVGFLGEPFVLVKFRTMGHDSDPKIHQQHFKHLLDSGQPMTKLDHKNDSRIIPFGNSIRCLGLDELPQLWNILKGEMSLVGPRPCIEYECEHYQEKDFQRLATLPGLTGLWQVSGKNLTSFQRMIDLDLDYVNRRSLFLDCLIILKTFPAILYQTMMSRRKNRKALQPTLPCRDP